MFGISFRPKAVAILGFFLVVFANIFSFGQVMGG